MNVKSTIHEQIVQVAEEQGKALAPLGDGLVLLESGLDSLCFAVLVARLESILGTDPFVADDDVQFPVTIGDLIRLYEHAVAG